MSERMIERDEETQNWLKDTSVNGIRSKVPPLGRIGQESCDECGDDIPMKRRELGYDRCVDCVEREERHGR